MDMKKDDVKIEDVIKEISNLPDVKKLPPLVQELIKKGLESAINVQLSITTFKENDEWIATTPIIDVCAQGATRGEAIESIKDMIDDYLSDPHTKKPKVETIMQVKVQSINLPLEKIVSNYQTNNDRGSVSNARQNTPITKKTNN